MAVLLGECLSFLNIMNGAKNTISVPMGLKIFRSKAMNFILFHCSHITMFRIYTLAKILNLIKAWKNKLGIFFAGVATPSSNSDSARQRRSGSGSHTPPEGRGAPRAARHSPDAGRWYSRQRRDSAFVTQNLASRSEMCYNKSERRCYNEKSINFFIFTYLNSYALILSGELVW